jgi:hypothetical protein
VFSDLVHLREALGQWDASDAHSGASHA